MRSLLLADAVNLDPISVGIPQKYLSHSIASLLYSFGCSAPITVGNTLGVKKTEHVIEAACRQGEMDCLVDLDGISAKILMRDQMQFFAFPKGEPAHTFGTPSPRELTQIQHLTVEVSGPIEIFH